MVRDNDRSVCRVALLDPAAAEIWALGPLWFETAQARLLTMSLQPRNRRCTRTMNTVSWLWGSAGSSVAA
jgi:hypothetical protein